MLLRQVYGYCLEWGLLALSHEGHVALESAVSELGEARCKIPCWSVCVHVLMVVVVVMIMHISEGNI